MAIYSFINWKNRNINYQLAGKGWSKAAKKLHSSKFYKLIAFQCF
jgi:hypothetical protein